MPVNASKMLRPIGASQSAIAPGKHRRAAACAAAGATCIVILAGLAAEAGARSGLPGANGKIAFCTNRDGKAQIYAMNADGGDQTRLTSNTYGDCARAWSPAWSPEGKRIAFTNSYDGDRNREVEVMNADGSDQVNVTNSAGFDGYPAWSPDGERIAFASSREGGYGAIYVMNAVGSGQTRLTDNPGGDSVPAWSPDGQRIAFVSYRDGTYQIYVMKADGSEQTRLTYNDNWDTNPTWSPDGERIAFASDRDGNYEIYAMNADGSDQTRLTDSSGRDASPAWSPDGERIAFASDRDGNYENYEIYVMRTDGSGQTRLTSVRKDDMDPAWQPIPNDLSVRAQASPPAVAVGGQATYSFTVTNGGSAPAPGTMLSVTPPRNMQISSVSTRQGTCLTGETITCNLGSVAALAGVTVPIVAQASGDGPWTAQGTVDSWGIDSNPANDTAEASVAVSNTTGGSTPDSGSPPWTGLFQVRDATPLGFTLTGRRRQRALRRRAVIVYATCDRACLLTVRVRLRPARRRTAARLIRLERYLAAGARTRLRVKLSRRALTAIRRALKGHRRGRVVVAATATDGVGNRRTAKTRVRIVR